MHTLSPNVYRTREEALQAFNHFSDVGEWEKHFSEWERWLVVYVGATAMYFVGKKLKKRHLLKDDVRLSLYDACRQWHKAIGKKRMFMGGERPNLADLAVYGVLSSIEGTDAFRDLLKHTHVAHWYYNVQECCKQHGGHRQIQEAL